MSDGKPEAGTWGQLLGPRYLAVMVVLAGGVAVYATNVYVATSLLPSAVAEIGGQRLYAWNTTIFLLASVASSMLVSRLLHTMSGRIAYLLALGSFVAGTVVCASAPSMVVLLSGRAVQGAGGGLLAGLGYVLIRSTLPSSLWARGTALASAMWGVGTFVGPALGGALAEFASWRGAFVVLAGAAAVLAAIVPRALGHTRARPESEGLPLLSLLLVTAAALVVSVASIIATLGASILGVAVGLMLLAGFIVHERQARTRIFPATTFTTGSRLRWIYATIAVLAIGSTTEGFVPLFGQRLAGLAPLAAGFLGAALAAGWTLGQIPSASTSHATTARRIIIAGPIVLVVGLAATALTQQDNASGLTVSAWVFGLLVTGAGIGMAWPHLCTSAMNSVTDPGEGNKASAAINTVQLLANAFGASLTGVLVNLGGNDSLVSARYLFAGFALLTILGVATAAISQRPATTSELNVSAPRGHR